MRILILSAVGLLACGGPEPVDHPDAADSPIDAVDSPLGDIGDELRAIPGMTSVEERSTMADGYRFFVMTYQQPVDHADPSGAQFGQRLTLLHRDYRAPVVVYNSGYNLSTRGGRSQVTVLTDGNQLSMEHRYFAPSRPEPADWSKLDIEQAAGDQHRIIEALRARIYHANRWLSTGASKGGMTSLFHRRFYPDDVDGTVAYVAPIDYAEDQVASPTNRYIAFLENVGTDAGCRQKLKDFQNLVLARRDAMKTRMRGDATFTAILGEDRALDFAVVELPFIFWQYGRQADCSSIPATGASDNTVYGFLDAVVSMASYGDDDLIAFLPYYHQSATQLGYPAADESYLVGELYPGEDTALAYLPTTIPTPPYDQGAAMHDVQAWIAASGERIMLVYGQNDPWSAGAVELGAATDSFKYVAPGANHGASLSSLSPQESAEAQATILRWVDLPSSRAVSRARLAAERTVEQDELELRRPR